MPLGTALRLLLLALLSPLLAAAQPTARSPWLGVWTARLGEYGLIALNVGDRGDGVPSRVEVWWLVDHLRPAALWIEDRTLFIDLPDHTRTARPGLALRLTDTGTLRFVAHGMLPAPLDPLYETAEFTRPKDDNPWYRITNTFYKTSEWGKWHESGRLKPLPADWPSSVTSPLLRLFAYDDHLLHHVVILPSLSEAELTTAYAWTHDKNIWSNGPDFIRQRIGQNPNTPLPILTELWNHPDNSPFWITAAQNPRAPAAWRAALIDRILTGSESAQSRAIWTGDGPPELYLRLIEKSPRLRGQIAGNREMPAVVYETLARDYPKESLPSLTTNPSVPVALLESIAASADTNLQFSLINNPSLPPATRTRLVHQLLSHATPAHFARFVHDPDAPADFLARCATDLDPNTRVYAARNPNTPEPLLLTFAEDPSRPVAEAARTALQSRFPSAFARHRATFTSLDARAADIPLHQQFETAIASSDLPALRRLTAYHADRNQLDGILSQNAHRIIQDGYRPAVMNLFLELGFASDRGHLAPLAGKSAANPEWLAYFKKHDAFAGPHAAGAYRAALESKDPANLTALVRARVDPNQFDDQRLTALHRAVLMHDLAAVELLLKNGADPSLHGHQQRTALDYAVALKFIPAIRLLDEKGQHAALVAAFAKEFPPAPKSRLLGLWTNNKDGFSTVRIQLNPDGSGRFGGGVSGGLLAWRETSPTEATAYLLGETGDPVRTQPFALSLSADGKLLTFTPPQGAPQQMIREPK